VNDGLFPAIVTCRVAVLKLLVAHNVLLKGIISLHVITVVIATTRCHSMSSLPASLKWLSHMITDQLSSTLKSSQKVWGLRYWSSLRSAAQALLQQYGSLARDPDQDFACMYSLL
jgi:hypothetical protein